MCVRWMIAGLFHSEKELKYCSDGETSGCDIRFGSPVCEFKVIVLLMWNAREFYA